MKIRDHESSVDVNYYQFAFISASNTFKSNVLLQEHDINYSKDDYCVEIEIENRRKMNEIYVAL